MSCRRVPDVGLISSVWQASVHLSFQSATVQLDFLVSAGSLRV